MKFYDKDALVLEYLKTIQAQDKEIKALKAENTYLANRTKNLETKVKAYRISTVNWKQAYTDTSEELNETNKVLMDLVDRPVANIAHIIAKYKENS